MDIYWKYKELKLPGYGTGRVYEARENLDVIRLAKIYGALIAL